MSFHQSRNIKATFTKFINKVFALNSTWINEDIEVVSLSGDNSPKAYEQYPWDNEDYPIVVLFSEGSQDDKWAIDSIVSPNLRYTFNLGSTAREYTTMSQYPIVTGIIPRDDDLILQNADLLVKNIGPYEEPIFVDIYDDSSGEPSNILASGSIEGTKTVGIEWLNVNITPHITLAKDSTYYLSARAPSGSYYWFSDNNISATVTPDPIIGIYNGATWAMTSDESFLTKVYSPSVKRLGGGLSSTIRVFCEAKDLSTAQKITDLIYVYLQLSKHSNTGRQVKLTLPSTMTSMDFDFASDLTDEGIYIINVSKGAETVRVRGNDRLFAVDVIVSCYSSWSEDFEIPTLEDIGGPDIVSIQKVLNKY